MPRRRPARLTPDIRGATAWRPAIPVARFTARPKRSRSRRGPVGRRVAAPGAAAWLWLWGGLAVLLLAVAAVYARDLLRPPSSPAAGPTGVAAVTAPAATRPPSSAVPGAGQATIQPEAAAAAGTAAPEPGGRILTLAPKAGSAGWWTGERGARQPPGRLVPLRRLLRGPTVRLGLPSSIWPPCPAARRSDEADPAADGPERRALPAGRRRHVVGAAPGPGRLQGSPEGRAAPISSRSSTRRRRDPVPHAVPGRSRPGQVNVLSPRCCRPRVAGPAGRSTARPT